METIDNGVTTQVYNTPDGKVRVTKYEVEDSFTNHFAQKVLKLKNGATLYIDYGDGEITFEEKVIEKV